MNILGMKTILLITRNELILKKLNGRMVFPLATEQIKSEVITKIVANVQTSFMGSTEICCSNKQAQSGLGTVLLPRATLIKVSINCPRKVRFAE